MIFQSLYYFVKTSSRYESILREILSVILVFIIGVFPGLVYALPQDGKIVSGSGSINNDSSGNLTVNQASDKIAIDWQSFSIGNNESVMFIQPSASASALNNVVGSLGSVIQGTLNANGQIILTNPNGIHISPTANIDVGSLITSTLNISTQDFVNNLYRFAQNPDQPLGFILNEGTIRASDFVALIAPGVENKGVVIANLGTASVVAGEEVTVDFVGDELINFSITKAVAGTVLDKEGNPIGDQINNSGMIQANGGQVILSARSTSEIIKNVVNNEGMIEANTVVKKDGKILLMGGDHGIVRVSGALAASGNDAGEKGGVVHVLGEKVALSKGSVVDVSGDIRGGEALIGGDYQGSNSKIQNAWRTYVDKDAAINAEALTDGDGGRVIVWADDANKFYGNITATGGTTGGDGGFAEVSGKNFLDFKGNTNLSSPYGEMGTLLLDPNNVTIVDNGTAAVGAVDQFGDTGSLVNIDADALDDAGANITIQANNNITVDEEIDLSTTGATLTLTAKNNIVINDEISTTNGEITLTAGNDFVLTGSIDSGSASTTIALYDGGTIGLGSAACGGSCDMTISGSELEDITSTGLVIGGSNTEDIYVDTVGVTKTQNVTGTVFLESSNSISFVRAPSAFGALTLTSDGDVSFETNVTIGGNFTATADDDSDEEGDFTIDTGVRVTVTGNATIEAVQINMYGVAMVTGTTSLTGQLVSLDIQDILETVLFAKLEDDAFDSLFMDDLGDMMDEFGGGRGC